jgi:hypothetical protein
MHILLIVVLAAHVLAAVFWAGTTFVLARNGGNGASSLFRPQMGAASVAILSGAYLWAMFHRQSFGVAETILGIGIVAALVAVALQALLVGGALRAGSGSSDAGRRVALGERLAAALLIVTVVCMATARYA